MSESNYISQGWFFHRQASIRSDLESMRLRLLIPFFSADTVALITGCCRPPVFLDPFLAMESLDCPLLLFPRFPLVGNSQCSSSSKSRFSEEPIKLPHSPIVEYLFWRDSEEHSDTFVSETKVSPDSSLSVPTSSCWQDSKRLWSPFSSEGSKQNPGNDSTTQSFLSRSVLNTSVFRKFITWTAYINAVKGSAICNQKDRILWLKPLP